MQKLSMYGLLITQSIDIKENGFCNIITKAIFMSMYGLNLSHYGYIMSMYGLNLSNYGCAMSMYGLNLSNYGCAMSMYGFSDKMVTNYVAIFY